ncbi:MAG: HAD family hydrolase [Clostridia bacterium]|nr:HAD family hydrolase [Clostridia bacterium]
MRRPRMILFDYGHTLLYEPDWNAERGDRALLAYAVKNPKNCGVEEIRREVAQVFGEIERVRDVMGYDISCVVGDRLVYEHLGIEFSLTPHEQETVFWTAACPGAIMPGADRLLDVLAEAGIRTAVLSNNGWSGEAIRERFDRLLPGNRFEFVMSSADYLIRKPDPRLFEIALLKAGLDASEVWYVGDSLCADVYGSHAAGLFPVWYEEATMESRYDVTGIPLPDFAYLRVTSLDELARIVEGLS